MTGGEIWGMEKRMKEYHARHPWSVMARAEWRCPGTLPGATSKDPERQRPGADCYRQIVTRVHDEVYRNLTLGAKVQVLAKIHFDHTMELDSVVHTYFSAFQSARSLSWPNGLIIIIIK